MDLYTRSVLFIPGNNPNLIANADLLGSDGIVLDLEDAVSKNEKDAARKLVKNALMSLDFADTVKLVRINGLYTDWWKLDLDNVIKGSPDIIMVPKLETKEEVQMMCEYITEKEKEYNLEEGKIKIAAIIETAIGLENAHSIASANPRICSLSIGGEDFTDDLGAKRTKEGYELLYSRSKIIVAARAAGVSPIDTIFADIEDDEGLRKDTEFSKNMGFDGKVAIAPRQVDIINSVFTPSDEEIKNAQNIVDASKKAEKEGKGVFSFEGKMVDAPVVNRALKVIKLAKRAKGGVTNE